MLFSHARSENGDRWAVAYVYSVLSLQFCINFAPARCKKRLIIIEILQIEQQGSGLNFNLYAKECVSRFGILSAVFLKALRCFLGLGGRTCAVFYLLGRLTKLRFNF